MNLKIICVEFENLKQFENQKFRVDFIASDRVLKKSELFKLSSNVATQNIIGFIGLNATGKTTSLRLLKTALEIVIRNTDLNSAITSDLIVDDTIIRTTFFYNNKYHQLESVIGIHDDTDKFKFYYKKETLKHKKASTFYSRTELTDFTNADVENRSDLQNDVAKYLDESKSIVNPTIKGNNSYISDNLWMNYANPAVLSGKAPAEILDVFDDSIEEFSMSKSSSNGEPSEWKLKFKNDNWIYSGNNTFEPNLLISAGTISGQRLIHEAITVLKKGGYLLIDELEAHMNKELIRVILGLFGSTKTNPNGACIIFSTHYVEILDFNILNRKDNIYITRKKNFLLSVKKFSDDFKRNDFKKSEIILSNLLTGTAPKYEAIERLRDFVCNQVR